MNGKAIAGLLALVALSGCDGKMKTKRPENILTIRNDRIEAYSNPRAQDIPLLPILPAGANIGPAGLDPSPGSASDLLGPPLERGTPQEANVAQYPYSAMAKLEFLFPSTPDGYQNTCSGQFVGASDVILTAAHCIYDNDKREWITSWGAKRAYVRGQFAEQYDWHCAAIFSGWTEGNYQRDYAFVKLRSRSPSWMSLDLAMPGHAESIGYPSNYYSGQVPMRVDGPIDAGRGVSRMRGNPFGKGSSGGAWHVGGVAVSVNSFKYDNDPNSMYGPTFNSMVRTLFNHVQQGCPPDTSSRMVASLLSDVEKDESVIVVGGRETGNLIIETENGNPGKSKVVNRSAADYAVVVTTIHEGKEQRTQLLVLAGATVDIPCKSDGRQDSCDVAGTSEIIQSARVFPSTLAAEDDERSMVTPDFCSARCSKTPLGSDCMRLGAEARLQIGPMAGFIMEDLRKVPKDGVVATMDDLVLRFGGKPGSSEDPCARSDFLLREGRVENRGLDCSVISPESKERKTRLALNAPSLTAALPEMKSARTLFDRRPQAPEIEFVGENSGEFNTHYGGKVVAVETKNRQLIVTTENGCLVANQDGN